MDDKGGQQVRYVKIFGLAAVAAMVFMAFAGAGSASATVLCKENASPCPEEQRYESGAVLKWTAENTVITWSPNMKCAHSEMVTEVTESGGEGEPVTGTVTNFSFTGCKLETISQPSCTVGVKGLPYHAEVIGSGGNGAILVSGATAEVFCAGVFVCSFGSEVFELPVAGGNPAKIIASNYPLEIGGILCPNEARWDTVFKAVAPNIPVWVVTE